MAVVLLAPACGGADGGGGGVGTSQAAEGSQGSEGSQGTSQAPGSDGARAALSGVLLDGAVTNPDNVSLDFGDAAAMPPVYVADGEIIDGVAQRVACSVVQDASGSTVGASLGDVNKTRFSFDATTIPASGPGTGTVVLVQPQNGVELTTPAATACTFLIDSDTAPSTVPGSIRIELACDEVSNDEHGIRFALEATVDLEGCDPDPP